MNFFTETWNWYIAGPLIGLFVPALLIAGNKLLGLSSSFEHICSIILPKAKAAVLNYDVRKNGWKYYFVLGILIGGFVGNFIMNDNRVAFLPEIYHSFSGMVKLFTGGILVGFGTRYANGCTSGHAITGLSLLNPASLKSTIGFFIGGLIYTWSAIYLF